MSAYFSPMLIEFSDRNPSFHNDVVEISDNDYQVFSNWDTWVSTGKVPSWNGSAMEWVDMPLADLKDYWESDIHQAWQAAEYGDITTAISGIAGNYPTTTENRQHLISAKLAGGGQVFNTDGDMVTLNASQADDLFLELTTRSATLATDYQNAIAAINAASSISEVLAVTF